MKEKHTSDAAIEIIRVVGEVKANNTNETEHTAVLDFMSRAVMRAPSAEAKRIITTTKDKLKLFFENCSEEEINWVFSHGKESRGFFQNYVDPNNSEYKGKREALLAWLNRPTSSSWFTNSACADTTSMDISLINGIIASISYAAFDNNVNYEKVDNSGLVSTHDCTAIKNKCASLMAHSPYVGSYLPERADAIVRKTNGQEMRLEQEEHFEATDARVVPAPRRLVSAASVDEDAYYASTIPAVRATRRLFYTDTGYAGIASEKNRLVGHYSANTTSALFILNELFKLGETLPDSKSSYVLKDKEAKIFAGLIAAEYHRSAFHSPEEVYLGAQPYLERLKLGEAYLDKGEFEKYLANKIPQMLPHSDEDLVCLTKSAIEMMGDASMPNVAEAMHDLANDVANNPNIEMPEEEVVHIAQHKNKSSHLFTKFKQYYEEITNKKDENTNNNQNDINLDIEKENKFKKM